MYSLTALALTLAPLAIGAAVGPHSAPPPVHESHGASSRLRVPSVYESAVQARRILQLQGLGTMSTVFPSSLSSSSSAIGTREQRPADVGDAPIGLLEYYAACGPEPWHPSIIGVTLATSMKNAAAGSNTTLSLRYELPLDAPLPPPDPWAYLPANLPRFALVGYLEKRNDSVKECFLQKHPEAAIWMPGTDIHDSWWGRLVVNRVYFFGGFGDRARITWLPIDTWRGIPQKEVDEYRLVGERGYEESQRRWRAREQAEQLQKLLGMEL